MAATFRTLILYTWGASRPNVVGVPLPSSSPAWGGYFVAKDGDDFIFCRPDGSLIPPLDDSLRKNIARAQRDLTIIKLTGSVEEQRAVYRLSRDADRRPA